MKKMLGYYLKSRWHVVLIISLILMLITFISLFDVNFIYRYEYYDEYDQLVNIVRAENSPFATMAVFAAILSTLVVVFEFYFKMRKVNIDQIYALPIKREKIYLSKLIVCLAEVIIPLTLSFILSVIMVAIKPHMFELIYFIPYYFGLIFLVCVLVCSFAFVYTRANTFFDGLINMLMYTLVLVFVFMLIIDVFAIGSYKFGDPSYFFIYSPITVFCSNMNDLFCGRITNLKPAGIMSFVVFIVFGLLSIWLFVKLNKEEASENCTQVSSSYFSYKTMIPIFSLIFFAFSVLEAGLVALTFTLIFTYLFFVIYKRTFKLNKKEYIIIALLLVVGIALGLVSNAIHEAIINDRYKAYEILCNTFYSFHL